MMGKFTLLYDVFSDVGTLYGGSYVSTLPVANAQNADIGTVARTTNPLTSSTRVNVDLGKVRSVGGIALGPLNVSPGAQYRIRTYDDAAMGSGDIVYDSGTKNIAGTTVASLDLEWEDPGFWYGVDSDAIDDLPTWLVEIIPEADVEPVRWASVEIFDTSNADGYVQFGRLLVARAWRPAYNYSYGGNSFAIDPRTEMNESEGGLRTYDERGQRRTLQVAFENLPEDDLFGDVFRIMNRSGISRQVYVVPDPADASFFQRRSFLATFRQAPAIAQVLFERGSTAFDFEEVL
jgi:hypothetical protein